MAKFKKAKTVTFLKLNITASISWSVFYTWLLLSPSLQI